MRKNSQKDLPPLEKYNFSVLYLSCQMEFQIGRDVSDEYNRLKNAHL